MDSLRDIFKHSRSGSSLRFLKIKSYNEDIFQEHSLRDNKSLVIVERQGTYQVSSDDVTKNVYQFSGTENTLKITRVYSTEWLCSYEMINYPFDTQVHNKVKIYSSIRIRTQICPMIFTPAGISKTFLKLHNRNHIYSGPTELTQYFVRYLSIGN